MGDRAYIYWLPKRRTAAPTLTTTNARATQLSLLILLLSLAWLACVVSTTTLTESGHGLNGHGVPQTTDLGDDDTEETVLASLKRRAFQVWNRARDNLPTSYYFDFEQFVKQFKRNYYDASEAYFRRSVFMRKAVEIFQNHIKLRLGLTGLRLAVNKFSDRTRVEFNRMYQIVRPSLLFLGDATDAGMDDKEEEGGLRKQKQRQESDDEADQLLDIYSGPAIANLGRKLDSELQGKAELEARIEAAVQDEFLSSVEPPVKLEATSLARDTTTEQATTVAKLKPMRPRKLPKPGRLKSPPDEHDHNHDELMMAPPYEPPRLEAHQLVGLDWSRHACFHEIYEQEPDCGNCYVIAATSVAEFYSCSEGVTTSTGSKQITRIKFSKDYVLQCAQKFVPTVMGCLGGSIFDTVRFIAIAGANKVRSWKTKREKALLAMLKELGGQAPTDPLDIGCPLDPDVVPIKEWGSVRVRLNPVRVHPNHWLEALEDGPLLVSVQMPPDGVDSYSGGVHNGQGCESSALFHAMVLVGYGLNENGEPYWRFRNSFGPDWGDRGHFHLSMAIPAGCIVESIRIYREQCKSCEHWS